MTSLKLVVEPVSTVHRVGQGEGEAAATMTFGSHMLTQESLGSVGCLSNYSLLSIRTVCIDFVLLSVRSKKNNNYIIYNETDIEEGNAPSGRDPRRDMTGTSLKTLRHCTLGTCTSNVILMWPDNTLTFRGQLLLVLWDMARWDWPAASDFGTRPHHTIVVPHCPFKHAFFCLEPMPALIFF